MLHVFPSIVETVTEHPHKDCEDRKVAVSVRIRRRAPTQDLLQVKIKHESVETARLNLNCGHTVD